VRPWQFLRKSLRGATLSAALLAGLSLALGPSAHAAMNFCAAPALQNNETTLDAPAVQALTRDVSAHLGDAPRVRAHLHVQRPGDADDLALGDLTLLRDAALAWRVTNDNRYLAFVNRYLRAWVDTYQPSFDPSDEYRFASLILAYDMTASVLRIDVRNDTAAFIGKLGNGYARQALAAPAATAGQIDEAQNRRIELIAQAGFTLSDHSLMTTARTLYLRQIGQLNAPGGSTSASASVAASASGAAESDVTRQLKPLVITALAARRFSRTLLYQRAPNGASLAGALDRAAPGASADDAGVYYLAARLDGRYERIARRLAPHAPGWIAACLPLAAAASIQLPH
jgi:hypothetical protein